MFQKKSNILYCSCEEFKSFLDEIITFINEYRINNKYNKAIIFRNSKQSISSIHNKPIINKNSIIDNKSINLQEIKVNKNKPLKNPIELIMQLENGFFVICTKNNHLVVCDRFLVSKIEREIQKIKDPILIIIEKLKSAQKSKIIVCSKKEFIEISLHLDLNHILENNNNIKNDEYLMNIISKFDIIKNALIINEIFALIFLNLSYFQA